MYKIKARLNSILWEKPGNSWKRASFKILDDLAFDDARYDEIGKSRFSDITLAGKFLTHISELDVSAKTTFELILDDNPKYMGSYDLKADKKIIDPKKLIKNEFLWKVLLLQRLGFPKSAYSDLVKDKKKGEEFFNDLVKITDDQLFADKIQSLNGIGKANSIKLAQRFYTLSDNDLRLNSFKHALFCLNYNFSDAKMQAILDNIPNEKEQRSPLDIIKNDFYSLMQVKGLNYKSVDELYLSNKNNSLADKTRIKSLLMYYLNNVFEEHVSWYSIKELSTNILDSINNNELKIKAVNNIKICINELLDEEKIVLFKPNNGAEARIMSKQTFDFEKNVQAMLTLLNKANITRISDNEIKEGIEEAEDIQGFKFTDEQINTIKTIINTPVATINGFAGTGKSTILRACDIILKNAGLNFTQVAFTGRASDSLARSTGFPAKTIHSTFKILSDNDENIIKDYISKLTFNEELTEVNPGPGAQLPDMFTKVYSKAIIVDEYATSSIVLFAMLLFEAIRNNARLLLVGDSGQLPAIQFSADQAVNSNFEIGHLNLTAIKRQGDASKIIEHSLDFRQGKLPEDVEKESNYRSTFKDVNYSFMNSDQQMLIETKEIFDLIKREISKDKNESLRDVAILSPLVAFNEQLNQMIQKEVVLDYDKYFEIGKGKKKYPVYEGELIINTVNSYDGVYTPDGDPKSIFNGNVGTVLTIKEEIDKYTQEKVKFMDVDFGPNGIIRFEENDKQSQALDLAYAMTVHKSQGSTIDYVICVLPQRSPKSLKNRQILYTAMTRAKKKLFIVANKKTIIECTKRSADDNSRSNIDIFNKSVQGKILPENALELKTIKKVNADSLKSLLGDDDLAEENWLF